MLTSVVCCLSFTFLMVLLFFRWNSKLKYLNHFLLIFWEVWVFFGKDWSLLPNYCLTSFARIYHVWRWRRPRMPVLKCYKIIHLVRAYGALSSDWGFFRVPDLLDRIQELVIFTPVAECVAMGVPLRLLILISMKFFKILKSTFLWYMTNYTKISFP